MGAQRTLLVNVLGGKLVLLAQEAPDHRREYVASRAARAASRVLRGAGEVVVIVVKGDRASSGRDCGGGAVLAGVFCCCCSGVTGSGLLVTYAVRCHRSCRLVVVAIHISTGACEFALMKVLDLSYCRILYGQTVVSYLVHTELGAVVRIVKLPQARRLGRAPSRTRGSFPRRDGTVLTRLFRHFDDRFIGDGK